MNNQNYSGKVNLDHPIIDEREDGTYLYFHDLPPIMLKNPIILPEEDDENQTTD